MCHSDFNSRTDVFGKDVLEKRITRSERNRAAAGGSSATFGAVLLLLFLPPLVS